jgi:hypothetical protein
MRIQARLGQQKEMSHPSSLNHPPSEDPLPRSPTVAHLEHMGASREVNPFASAPQATLPPISSAQALASMGEAAEERIMLCLRNESRGEDKTMLDP